MKKIKILYHLWQLMPHFYQTTVVETEIKIGNYVVKLGENEKIFS